MLELIMDGTSLTETTLDHKEGTMEHVRADNGTSITETTLDH